MSMGLTFTQLLFYCFAGMLVAAASMVVLARNPVYSALYLVLTFFTAAAVWMLLEVEFLAIVLVVVYVGAVMVLFLFVVMMLDIRPEPAGERLGRFVPVGLTVAGIMAAELLTVLWARDRFGALQFPVPAPTPAGVSNTQAVGEWLFTRYLLPFEVAGIILLVAIVAAISLTLRRRTGTKTQIPAHQVRIQRNERVRLVDLPRNSPPADGGN